MAMAIASGQAVIVALALLLGGLSKFVLGQHAKVATASALGRLVQQMWATRVWVAFAAAEIASAVVIFVLPASRVGPAMAVGLLFATTSMTAIALQSPKPTPCGCYGAASHEPASTATLLRSVGLLIAAAFAVSTAPHRWTSAFRNAGALTTLLAETVIFVVVSPDLRHVFPHLRAERQMRESRCQHRLTAIKRWRSNRTETWRLVRKYIVSHRPSDQWLDGCWAFRLYRARFEEKEAEAVVAVWLGRFPEKGKSYVVPVRAAIVGCNSDSVLLDLTSAQATELPPSEIAMLEERFASVP
jgi:hypothetical protein